MNLVTHTTGTKIEADHLPSITKNILRDKGRASEDFKIYYSECLHRKGIKQHVEGTSIDICQSQLSKYLDTESIYDLPAFQVPRSRIKDELLTFLAHEAGGHYTPEVKGLNGSTRDELSAIVKASASIIKHEGDKEKEKAEFTKINEMALRALEELV